MDEYKGLIAALRKPEPLGEGRDYLVRQKAADVIEDLSEKLSVANFYMRETQKAEERAYWISHDFVDLGKGRYTGSVECSVCHRFLPIKEKFCPSCGSVMREERAVEGAGPYEGDKHGKTE